MHVSKRIDLALLETQLAAASVAHNGLSLSGSDTDAELLTFGPPDESGTVSTIELPPAATPVVNAHVAPPRLVEYTATQDVHAIVRTTDATPLEVFRFPCTAKRVYQASLSISGVDAVSGAIKVTEGRFVWKRPAATALMVGITVVSDLHDAAAAAWAPNAQASGTDIVFTVQGAAGRTIDWLLVGSVGTYASTGLAT